MYYYLTASLPVIALGDRPPMSPEAYVFHAQGALSAQDHAELSLLMENRLEECTSDFAQQWHNIDTQIRNQVARIRANRLSVDARPYQRTHAGFRVTIEHEVSDAMTRANPLERVMALDRCRWNALDELSQGEPFGFAKILAYGLKLRLLERWDRMSDEVGLERLETFITENVEKSMEQQRLGDA